VVLAFTMFFSMSEIALFALQKVDREALKEDPGIGEIVRHLLSRPRRLLAALLIGAELSNIAFSAVSADFVLDRFPDRGWINVVVIAPILIVFGDVLPRTIALRFSREATRILARPVAFWNELVSPVRFVLTGIVDSALRVFGVQPPTEVEVLKEEQLRTLVDQGRATGVIQPIEQEIIHRVFEFGDLPVSRLMTPRPDIFSLSITTPWPELLKAIREARYSRVPLWQGTPENIIGILLVKDLLRLRGAAPPNPRQLQKMLHPAVFVPPSKRAQDLLHEFRKRNSHMVIVVDEHGSCQGLITLDDLLSELVGEVLDETDAEEKDAVLLSENMWAVRAGMDIDDFSERFGVELPEGDYTTAGGFVFHLLGRAPKKGDETSWNGVDFLVAGVEGRRITELTVTFHPKKPDEPEGEE
jgi:CBS domain containing-hemolysin-like protein